MAILAATTAAVAAVAVAVLFHDMPHGQSKQDGEYQTDDDVRNHFVPPIFLRFPVHPL
jgi:hypothetical protein